MRIRLSRLAALIERSVPGIPSPRRDLEQYTTPGELAARAALILGLRLGERAGDAVIADLGAGTCRLGVAAALLRLGRVIAVEADPRLAPLCLEAADRAGVGGLVEPVIGFIRRGRGPLAGADAVITNPPFGVWRRGADAEIVEYALQLGASPVVAILKHGNTPFFTGLASRYGYRVEPVLSYEFPIPMTMRHHRSRIRRVSVEVLVFEREE